MDADLKHALAQQAESFQQSELYRYLMAEIRAAAINLWVGSKASDEQTQKNAKYLLGVIDLFQSKLAALSDELKVQRAEEKRQKKDKKLNP